MNRIKWWIAGIGWALVMSSSAATFQEDIDFLSSYVDTLVLKDAEGVPKIAVVPAYQGRVMTSSADGLSGLSLGWLNYDASGDIVPHINVYGGEDRFWMGPEGGQFSIFFKAGDPFDLTHWQTPACMDTEPFDLAERGEGRLLFTKGFDLVNFSGTRLQGYVEREVALMSASDAAAVLGVPVPDAVNFVGYHTKNSIRNTGTEAWTREGGLLSIWILGMFNPSDATTVVVPFEEGSDKEKGAVVNDTYFGKVPADRLVRKDGVLYFSGDGKFRSKIGLSPRRAKPVAGSYDALNKVLTIVHYNKPEGVEGYVNSMWELQDQPYAGDVVNSYNDGPPAPGKDPLGPFYELETSSPAAELAAGERLTHSHRTFHFTGDQAGLDTLSKQVLGVGLDTIVQALK
jgi:hypothetical protein